MNTLDLLFVCLLVLSIFGGYRLGFVARAFSWLGLALGIGSALLLIPIIFPQKGATTSTQLVYALSMLLGLAFIGQTAGTILGSKLRDRIPHGGIRQSDRVLGAIAGFVGLTFFAWMLLPTLALQPGTSSRLVRSSAVARGIDRLLPSPPNALSVLERFVGSDRFPAVFDALKPAPDIPAPPTDIGFSSQVLTRVEQSTVRVVSVACGNRLQEGSGFFVRNNLIVTNAHVIAGQSSTTVYLNNGSRERAVPVVFDPNRDLAILDVTDRLEPPLTLADPERSQKVAVFGHPGGQEQLRIAPGTIAQRIEAVGRNIYDTKKTSRDVLVMASALRQGDSGSAVTNSNGDVVGVAFAIAPDRDGVSYALATTELRPLLTGDLTSAADTGKCIND